MTRQRRYSRKTLSIALHNLFINWQHTSPRPACGVSINLCRSLFSQSSEQPATHLLVVHVRWTHRPALSSPEQ